MNKRTLLISSLAVVTSALIMTGAMTGAQADWWPFSSDEKETLSTDEIVDISWGDLIPEDFIQPENPFSTMTQEEVDKLMDGSDESAAELQRLQEAFDYAPVVDKLDGMRVRIPAYVTPLEYNSNQTISEFLLVPYVGACIHTPPPPANQVVHANTATAIDQPNMYDPIWAVGVIRAKTVKSDLAESGYQLEVEEVFPYVAE